MAVASLGVGRQFLWWAARAMFAMLQFVDQSNSRQITEGTYAVHHCLLWYCVSCNETDHSKLAKVNTEAIFAIFAL